MIEFGMKEFVDIVVVAWVVLYVYGVMKEWG